MQRTLTQKATAVVLVFLTVIAVVAAFVFMNHRAIQATTNDLNARTVQETQLNYQFHTRLVDAVGAAIVFVHLRQAADQASSEQALGDARAALSSLHLLDKTAQDTPLVAAADRASLRQRQAGLLDRVQQIVAPTLRTIATGDNAGGEPALNDLNGLQDEVGQLAAATNGLLQVDIAAATRSVNLRLQQEMASLGLLLAPLALFMLRRGIVHPIQDLADAADAVAAGRFGQTTRVTNTDEIGTLQRAFNHMVHDLRAQRSALRQRNSALQHSLAQLEQAQATLREREEQYRAYVERTVLSG